MPSIPLLVLGSVVIVGLIVWSLLSHRARHQAHTAAVEQLGFRPCPERKAWLEETVTGIDNDQGSRYEVQDPKRLTGNSEVYLYVKRRHRDHDDSPFATEEILFPLKRPSPGGLVLTVKPSSLAHGLATRMIGAVAAGPWDTQPGDLQRLEIPPDLKETNLVAALGPPGVGLFDLLDSRQLGVVQGFGDAGGMFVQCRDGWCSVSRTGAQIPFRVDELVGRIRSLL